MTSDEQAFLDAIAAAPADDTGRLVYADWLDENGHAQRAECIRRGLRKPKRFTFGEHELARITYIQSERRDLPGTIDVTLASGHPGVRWTTYKGLVESATMTWERWLERSPVLVGHEWLPEVVLTTRPDVVAVEVQLPTSEDVTPPHARRSQRRCQRVRGYMIPGRELVHRVDDGEDPVRTVLAREWPVVNRWSLPEQIRLVPHPAEQRHLHPFDEPAIPQVGDAVTLLDGAAGVLLSEVDASGWGIVRRTPSWREANRDRIAAADAVIEEVFRGDWPSGAPAEPPTD